ncbi:MAG TPA: hypothetical protein VN811_00820 [Thermoanaerobaculia bacterium]|nr:hypothetical protein [Thermoanaerobaculia bacterium]
MSESRPRSLIKPDVDTYADVNIVEPRGLSAIAALLRARPSSDLAMVGAVLAIAYIGGKLADAKLLAGALAALGLPLLIWLVTLREEDHQRADQARSHQPRDQPNG